MLKIEIAGNTLRTLQVVHDLGTVTYNVAIFERARIEDPNRIFDYVNEYLATLDPDVQAELFGIYKTCAADIESIGMITLLQSKLRSAVGEICDLVNIDRFFNWLAIHMDTDVRDVSEEYNPAVGERDLTYIRSEYIGLIRLGVVIKLFLPLFGAYMPKTKHVYGPEFKEYRALDILTADIIQREEYQRLRLYVEANSRYNAKTTSAIYGGLGTEELPAWLFSFALIRKILLVDPKESNIQIIQKTYSYLKRKVEQLDKAFEKITDKSRVNDRVGMEEDNISVIENTKIKDEINPRAPRSIGNYITSRTSELARAIDPNVDLTMVKKCVVFANRNRQPVHDLHYMICGNMVSVRFSPRAVYLIESNEMSVLIGICQAILFQNGFGQLASLLTGKKELQDEDDMHFGITSGMSRVNKARLEQLTERWPHYRRLNGKELRPRNNTAIEWIDRLSDLITTDQYVYNEPVELAGEFNNAPINLDGDLKQNIADFALFLDKVYRDELAQQ